MNILVVDDFKLDREMLAHPFRSDHDVKCAADLEEAEKALENWWPDVALVDAMFPKKRNGQPVSRRFEDVRQWLAFGRVADVIPKSTADVGIEFFRAVIRLRVETLLERQRWRAIQNNAQSSSEWFAHFGILTKSPKVLELKSDLMAGAQSPACVLLYGRMGSGKELFANAIHRLARPGKKIRAIDCSTISPELFEPEMFGVQAVGKVPNPPFIARTGMFEAVADGTLFLDEIHNLKLEHQAKLLRVLQERRFRKVGANDDIPFLGKIVAATNRDLLEEVGKGTFREDLYYRIAVFKIDVPDLADRPEDIPLLSEQFLTEMVRCRREQGQSCPDIHLHPKSMAILRSAAWNGNVRQLRGVIEKTAEFALVERAGSETAVVIEPDLLLKRNPALGSMAPQLSPYDKLLGTSEIAVQRWSELSEDNNLTITNAIEARLSEAGKAQFTKMRAALRQREPGAGEDASGRAGQDPATIHCLKALLYVLLRADHRANLEDLRAVLVLGSWDQRKKVMNVLAAQGPSSPSYSPFVILPSRGGRQEMLVVDEMMCPNPFLTPIK